MTKELVSAWFNRLGEQERNLPLLIYQGGVYSPRIAYDEVMRGSPLGDALQALIERQSFGTSAEDEQTVAKLRLTEITRMKPYQDKPYVGALNGITAKIFTPAQMLVEIQNETDIARQWINNEALHMKRIVSVR